MAGGLVTLAGSLAPAFGALIPMVAGLGGGFVGLLAAIAPALPVIAAIAAAGALIYANWDKIAPVISDFWSATKEALGPPIMALIATVQSALEAFWNGPMGEGIRAAIGWLGELWMKWQEALGGAFLTLLKGALSLITGVFQQIGDAIRMVNAILTGDWAGAWDAAWSIVNRALGGIPELAAKMVSQLREWLIGRLDAVWQWVLGKIETVKKAFFGLYDAVVGHSYIPDMVDEIGQNMARLQSLMVDPAAKATAATKDAFRDLAGGVGNVLDRLFPLQAQLRAVLEDMATLEAARAGGLIDAGTYEAARGRLESERRDLQGAITPGGGAVTMRDAEPLRVSLEELSKVIVALPPMASDAEIALREFGQELGNGIMGSLRDVLTDRTGIKDAVRDLLSGFFQRTITDALRSLEKAVFGEGGLGGFLGSVLSGVISGRAVGGPVMPGRAYTVGNGELMVPSQSGRVLSRNDAMAAIGGGGGPLTVNVSVSGARGNREIMDMVREGVQQGIAGYDRVVGARADRNFRRRA